jgi:hypothetical protein
MPLWHKNYFNLKAIENQETQEESLMPQSKIQISP